MDNPFEILLDKIQAIEKLLTELTSNNKGNNVNKVNTVEILNLAEAAEVLHLAKPTIYGLTSARKIPHFKTGKRIYFKRDELIEWISKCRVKTVEDIEMEASTWLHAQRKNVRRRQ